MMNSEKNSKESSSNTTGSPDPHFRRTIRIMRFGLPIFLVLHSFLFLLFIFLRIPPLVYFNLFSVILYISLILVVRGRHTQVPSFLAYFEIAGTVLLCQLCLGWDSGFWLWIFTQGISVFMLYKLDYRIKWFLILLVFAELALLMFILKSSAPWYPLPETYLNYLFLYNIFTLLASLSAGFFYFNWSAELTEKALSAEHEKSRSLLLNILPESTAARLTSGENMIADGLEECSILFADLVGFTQISSAMQAEPLVNLLNVIFSEFDALTGKWKVEKIKTIGDSYMAAAGAPEPCDNPTEKLVRLGIDMLSVLALIKRERKTELELRIGIHTGKAVAGVIGKKKFTYDLWGDTVNTASRMESHGVPGRIQLSRTARDRVSKIFNTESRGVTEIKGKGPMETFLVVS